MPLYEFKCVSCGHHEIHRMSMRLCDVREIACEKCDELSAKQVSLSGFELKGGGWYASGYSAK